MPFPRKKKRHNNALARSNLSTPLQPRNMALVLGRDRWAKAHDPLGNESYSYRRFLAQQRNAMSGRGGGMYLNDYRNTFGRGGLGGFRTPRMRRPAFGGGYYGGYTGYGGYSRRPYTSLPRFGARPTQFRRPYSRHPSWSAFNYGGGLGRMRQQFQPRYRAYSPSPFRNRRRPYGRYPNFDEEGLSEDDYDESDLEDSYYPSPQRRWYNGYRDWGDGDDDDDDDDDDEWDEYGYDGLEEEDDSDFDEQDYDSDVYDEGRYGYGGTRINPRGYRW
ncbi:hypothetical protein P171DRAFT_136948 [Karstenula rhodostoma CBS 690.94]|uniref:Uncharacterized protein n=1 Tax=Karstenula rhodostoma CBS 690.94 TaxID=1392251 RepID=A0A9P4PVZ7_9PLEO|nr:hypothetical protein P171DRAFT_136948 [Karstenula rhodostoma CBS 690.94]